MNIRNLLSILFLLLCIGCKEEDSLKLYNSIISVEAEGGTFTVYATTNSDIKPTYPDWITLESSLSNAGQHAFTFSVPTYYSKEGRKGEIVFASGQVARVVQKKMSIYVPSEDLSGFGDLNDVQLRITNGWIKHGNNTGGFNDTSGPNVSVMWDGNKGQNTSMCNSPWAASWFGNAQGTDLTDRKLALFPHELKFYFSGDDERVDYMVYYPRPSNGNGIFGVITEVLVSTKENPNDFVTVARNYDCGMVSTVRTIYFSKPIYHPHTVWVKIGSAKDNFISCTEMEFFGKSSQSFDTSTLFADELCTSLKQGITLADIEACPYPFFKNIALYMYYECYETTFRIADFKAWEHPSKAATRNKTSTYSLLDNPTGIYVKKGEKLIAMAGDLHNQSVLLRVVDLDKPNGDGFDTFKEYALKPGMNIYTMEQKGLVYVMYHTDDFQTAEPVKIHLASGTVNGYFDLYNEMHNKVEDWSRLLNNASSPYLDVLGKYAHLTFPVSNLKKVSDPIEWVRFYDNLVYEEQKLMGLEKYGKMFNNRMYFNVMYTSYMYATSYRTSYNVTTLDGLCNLTQLKGDPWGPAHEVGHVNQTRPGLKWAGMSEVTNNIHSMYIRRLVGSDSRLLVKGYYPEAMTTAFAEGRPHIQVGMIKAKGADVFCQLVPFWQLQLYLGYVSGKTDFYADVYEYLRNQSATTEKNMAAWQHQLEFAYICSKISGLDLTEFFEKWGFLRKVDTTVTDYGTVGVFKIEDAELAAIKDRIGGLNLPKPSHNFWYITERTEPIFKENRVMDISKGSLSVDYVGGTISISGCSNVVAYEVYDKEAGKMIYVSPVDNSFTLPNNIVMPRTIEVRAVPASGASKVLTVTN